MPKIGFLPISLRMLATCGCERFGIAGAVGEEDAVGLEGEHVLGGCERGDHGDAAAGVHEAAQDVVLDAEVVGDDVEARLGRLRRSARRASRRRRPRSTRSARGGDAGGEVEAGHGGDGCGPWRRVRSAIGAGGREDAAHDAAGAQMADQGAGVDVGDDRDVGCRPGNRSAFCSLRQLLAMGENSRTTSPSM